jgi:retinol-binding protein 3
MSEKIYAFLLRLYPVAFREMYGEEALQLFRDRAYNRKENTTTQNWTLSSLPGQRLTKQPVFVLTAKWTFSGAEEFAFDLKNQQRATIVGETTGVGAHPVSVHTVADYFMIGVPFAKSVDPLTKTNWEGTGVEPDVKASATDALMTAEKLALEKVQAKKDGK